MRHDGVALSFRGSHAARGRHLYPPKASLQLRLCPLALPLRPLQTLACLCRTPFADQPSLSAQQEELVAFVVARGLIHKYGTRAWGDCFLV